MSSIAPSELSAEPTVPQHICTPPWRLKHVDYHRYADVP